MRILEYDEVDPLSAVYLTQLALDFALTPELARRIRQTDPRQFPCLAIYAEEDGAVMGQVGIFRLPMISTEGREDVGGVWAVSTHPQYANRGVASRLLDEAHTRMRAAGLRFSTLETDRYCLAHQLFRKHGYQDMNIWSIALAPWETAHQPTRLRAEPLGLRGYDFIEHIFGDIAKDYLGFAWRHPQFAPLRLVNLTDLWVLRENTRLVGYALARADQTILAIRDIVLKPGIDAAEAVAALTAELKSEYVQVSLSRPVETASLKRIGFHVASPARSSFMLKPLLPEVTVEEARQLFAIGTDRFLISWLDVT